MDPALRGWIHHVSVHRYLSGDLNNDGPLPPLEKL